MTVTARRSRKAVAVFSDAVSFDAGYKAVTEAVTVTAPDEPETDLFAAAAVLGAYYHANEASKELARTMRRSKKTIAVLKAGVYGGWKLAWKPSTRETPDMAAIEETYRRLSLGPVPMKPVANSIEITPV
jgi:hypothetical protein